MPTTLFRVLTQLGLAQGIEKTVGMLSKVMTSTNGSHREISTFFAYKVFGLTIMTTCSTIRSNMSRLNTVLNKLLNSTSLLLKAICQEHQEDCPY